MEKKNKIQERNETFLAGGRRKGESDNPFLSTRRTWNDYLAAQVASRKLWQTMTCLSLLIALADNDMPLSSYSSDSCIWLRI